MFKELVEISKSDMVSFYYTDSEVFGVFKNGKTYVCPICEFTNVLDKLKSLYDQDISI